MACEAWQFLWAMQACWHLGHLNTVLCPPLLCLLTPVPGQCTGQEDNARCRVPVPAGGRALGWAPNPDLAVHQRVGFSRQPGEARRNVHREHDGFPARNVFPVFYHPLNKTSTPDTASQTLDNPDLPSSQTPLPLPIKQGLNAPFYRALNRRPSHVSSYFTNSFKKSALF